MATWTVDKGLGWSGGLIVAGLLVQLLSSWLTHPLAFIGFLTIACPLVVAGMLVFLWTLRHALRAADPLVPSGRVFEPPSR